MCRRDSLFDGEKALRIYLNSTIWESPASERPTSVLVEPKIPQASLCGKMLSRDVHAKVASCGAAFSEYVIGVLWPIYSYTSGSESLLATCVDQS